MSYLYVTDSAAHLSMHEHQILVSYGNEREEHVPAELLENVSIFGRAQVTTQCMQYCMKRSIPIVFYSASGKYLGRLQAEGHTGVARQRLQAGMLDSDLALKLAQRIIFGKIHNQIVVLRRYAKSRKMNMDDTCRQMRICQAKASLAPTIEAIMGFEGTAARYYFEGLSRLVDPDFAYRGRSKRPPLDEFNAMLSFGYSLLMNEVYGKIEAKGLNPYFGFMHQDREKHPSLASDLMEEWRSVIVDSAVMSLVNGHEIKLRHFERGEEGGIYLTKDGMKIFLMKMEQKMRQENQYLPDSDTPITFRRAIELQVNAFTHVIENGDADYYHPIWLR